ncbi:MAG TPA: F0F1 ATP synthase subunit B [Solirubrobacteraceae bacterium]|jgi:F-type H+-transporting ATPase subunit b|nr:F0F1 ATP synthase subunit B [Solirubrobacteraceae bacterium]
MPSAVLTPIASASRSFLITPNVGLMVWTIVVFLISLFILRRAVFPRIGEALDKRAKTINGEIDTAHQVREEAEKVLEEYRERLKEARAQADEIVQRARQSADTHEQEAKAKGQEILAEAAKKGERDIEAATRRALDDIRKEVADLTILATEKVTRKTLDSDDQRKLVEQALSELDFSPISSGGAG